MLALAALSASGCVTPPAVLAPLPIEDRLEIPEWPPGSERIEVLLPSGERLRGLFVPADEGAPLVLHLLGAGASATEGNFTRELFWQLADRGWASLLLDYRGVGASDGGRSPTHLVEDARAAWEEALRRTGGDPSRVALRCTSLGSLAGTALLAAGARPAALCLWAPVRSETIVRNYARLLLGPLGGLLALLVDSPVLVDLERTLREVAVPRFVVLGERDLFLPQDEREAVRAAAGAPQAASEVRTLRETHMGLVYESFRLDPREERFLRANLPPAPDVEARLERLRAAPGSAALDLDELRELARLRRSDPPALAVRALRELGSTARADRWLDLARREVHARSGPEQQARLERVLALDDPAGRIPPALLLEWTEALAGNVFKQEDARGWTVDHLLRLAPEEVVELLADFGVHGAEAEDPPLVLRADLALGGAAHVTRIEQRIEHFWPARRLWSELEQAGFAAAHLHRLLVRVWLKALFVPERVRVQPDGSVRLEVLREGSWRTLALRPAFPAGGS